LGPCQQSTALPSVADVEDGIQIEGLATNTGAAAKRAIVKTIIYSNTIFRYSVWINYCRFFNRPFLCRIPYIQQAVADSRQGVGRGQ